MVAGKQSSMTALKEFLQVRIAIEPEAAALAARFATPEKIDAIETALEQMRAANDNLKAELEADIAFHVSVLYASQNRFDIRLRDFIQIAMRVSFRHTSSIKVNHKGVIEDHTKVLSTIKNRSPERAKHAMLLLG